MKKKKHGKGIIRMAYYILFVLSGISAVFRIDSNTSVPFWTMSILFVIIMALMAGLAELFTWITYWVFTKINYFGLKKPHNYEKDIKRYSLIFLLGTLILDGALVILINLKIIPDIGMFWRATYWWLVIIDIFYLVSLIGLYKLKKWGLHMYIITNILYQIEFNVFDYQGYSGLITTVVLTGAIIGYPYIRKKILK